MVRVGRRVGNLPEALMSFGVGFLASVSFFAIRTSGIDLPNTPNGLRRNRIIGSERPDNLVQPFSWMAPRLLQDRGRRMTGCHFRLSNVLSNNQVEDGFMNSPEATSLRTRSIASRNSPSRNSRASTAACMAKSSSCESSHSRTASTRLTRSAIAKTDARRLSSSARRLPLLAASGRRRASSNAARTSSLLISAPVSTATAELGRRPGPPSLHPPRLPAIQALALARAGPGPGAPPGLKHPPRTGALEILG